jgi:cation transport ATPase
MGTARNSPAEGLAILPLGAGRIGLSGSPLFARPQDPACRRFLAAVLAETAVQQVLLRPARSEAVVDFGPGPADPELLLRAVARALSSAPAEAFAAADRLFLRPAGDGAVRVTRLAGGLTSFEPVHRLPGRVRLRHPALLSRDRLCRDIEHTLAAQDGVLDAEASARTGSLLLVFDESVVDLADLLALLEARLHQGLPLPEDRGAEDVRFAAQSALTVLAAATDYLFPSLAPLCGALSLAATVTTFRKAANQIMRRRVGEEVVEAGFVLLAFAVSSFFSGQLLNWTFTAWPKAEAKALRRYKRRLLSAAWPRPAAATRLDAAGETRVPSASLAPGETVVVRAGMRLPVDGEVLSGRALVDESGLRGPSAPAGKNPGDTVLASCPVLRGRLVVRCRRSGEASLAARLTAALRQAAEADLPSLARLDAEAEKFFAPTLIGGILTLFWQGPQAAMAFLRPDYAHAPQLVPRLSLLASLVRLARLGVFVLDAAAFERLAGIDCLVLRLPAGTTLPGRPAALRALSPRIVLVADEGKKGRTKPAGGIERAVAATRTARAALVGRLARPGRTLAYAGFGDEDWETLKRAGIAIALDRDEAALEGPQILLPGADPAGLAALLAESRAHAERIERDARVAVLPNFATQAGAFLVEWGPMVSALASICGAAVVHGSGRLDLRGLDQEKGGATGARTGSAAARTKRTTKPNRRPAVQPA